MLHVIPPSSLLLIKYNTSNTILICTCLFALIFQALNSHIPFARSSFFSSFIPRVCRFWNHLPAALKDCPSLKFIYANEILLIVACVFSVIDLALLLRFFKKKTPKVNMICLDAVQQVV